MVLDRKANVMPIPQFNVINSGKHAGIDNDIQEHMIMPLGAKNFNEALRMGAETYHELKSLLKKKFGAAGTLLGDEGGFAPKISNVEDRLEIITKAIEKAGYAKKISLALDCAASEFFYKNHYKIQNKKYSSLELIDFYSDLIKKFDIISIEDGMAEDDWEGWKEMTKKLGDKIQIVGDDLLVTNTNRINKAVYSKACNSLLLKVNQIGTVTEAIDAAKIAFKNRWTVVVSHRSGETEDSFIADLVVGLAKNRKIDAISFLAETYGHPMYLGIKGAREILKLLNKKLGLNVDINRLDKEIKEVESEMIKRTEQLSEVSRATALKKLKGRLGQEMDSVNPIEK